MDKPGDKHTEWKHNHLTINGAKYNNLSATIPQPDMINPSDYTEQSTKGWKQMMIICNGIWYWSVSTGTHGHKWNNINTGYRLNSIGHKIK